MLFLLTIGLCLAASNANLGGTSMMGCPLGFCNELADDNGEPTRAFQAMVYNGGCGVDCYYDNNWTVLGNSVANGTQCGGRDSGKVCFNGHCKVAEYYNGCLAAGVGDLITISRDKCTVTCLGMTGISIFPAKDGEICSRCSDVPDYEFRCMSGACTPISTVVTPATGVVTETTPEVSPETTPEVSPETTPEVSPETTPEVSPETTPEVSPETTPEVSPETTAEVTPEITPAVIAETTTEPSSSGSTDSSPPITDAVTDSQTTSEESALVFN